MKERSTVRSAVYRLAAATNLDARTVKRVLDGEHVQFASYSIVRAAARRLRIEIPEHSSARAADAADAAAASKSSEAA